MFELVVTGEDNREWFVPLTGRALTVGRDPSNDIVFSEPSVSGHHALLWLDGETVWVRDLGSSNGTWIATERLRAPQSVGAGTVLRFGAVVRVRVRASEQPVRGPAYVLDDVGSAAQFPLSSDRFLIGTAPSADLRLEGDAGEATLLVFDNGEVWLGVDGEDRPLQPGDCFDVAGRRLRLRTVGWERVPTVVPVPERYRYRLEATLRGATGPEARVEELGGRASLKLSGGNRAVLLYLLGRKVAEDRKSGVALGDQGWCADDEVMVGLWGRHGDENKLHVLLHRLRADLKQAGFDPWFVEKRQRFVRARLAEVEIR